MRNRGFFELRAPVVSAGCAFATPFFEIWTISSFVMEDVSP